MESVLVQIVFADGPRCLQLHAVGKGQRVHTHQAHHLVKLAFLLQQPQGILA